MVEESDEAGTLTLSLSRLSLFTGQHWLVWTELFLHARHQSQHLQPLIWFTAHIKSVARVCSF